MSKNADFLKFQDKVKVISGFFEGLEGYVLDYDIMSCKYWTVLFTGKGTTKGGRPSIEQWISYEDLEKV